MEEKEEKEEEGEEEVDEGNSFRVEETVEETEVVDKEGVEKRPVADEGAVPRLVAIDVAGTICGEEEKEGMESMTASVGSTSGANRGCDKGHKMPLSPPLLSCRCISNALKHAS